MILVEADVSEEWDSSTDWAAMADSCVRAAIAETALARLTEAQGTAELFVRFTSDAEVRALNSEYRHKDKATNVLSFAMMAPDEIARFADGAPGEALLGDVVLAQGICAAEAAEKGVEIRDHAAHLVVHGTLHLLGFDHELGEAEAETMEAAERRALARLGISDPYSVAA